MLHAMRTMTQAQKAEGAQGVETRFEKNHVVWTKTVWQDEAATKKYRGSGAHQVAMRLLSELCCEAAYARRNQETPGPPTWEEAHPRVLRAICKNKNNVPKDFCLRDVVSRFR